jgi:hypothetical protein
MTPQSKPRYRIIWYPELGPDFWEIGTTNVYSFSGEGFLYKHNESYFEIFRVRIL